MHVDDNSAGWGKPVGLDDRPIEDERLPAVAAGNIDIPVQGAGRAFRRRLATFAGVQIGAGVAALRSARADDQHG